MKWVNKYIVSKPFINNSWIISRPWLVPKSKKGQEYVEYKIISLYIYKYVLHNYLYFSLYFTLSRSSVLSRETIHCQLISGLSTSFTSSFGTSRTVPSHHVRSLIVLTKHMRSFAVFRSHPFPFTCYPYIILFSIPESITLPLKPKIIFTLPFGGFVKYSLRWRHKFS